MARAPRSTPPPRAPNTPKPAGAAAASGPGGAPANAPARRPRPRRRAAGGHARRRRRRPAASGARRARRRRRRRRGGDARGGDVAAATRRAPGERAWRCGRAGQQPGRAARACRPRARSTRAAASATRAATPRAGAGGRPATASSERDASRRRHGGLDRSPNKGIQAVLTESALTSSSDPIDRGQVSCRHTTRHTGTMRDARAPLPNEDGEEKAAPKGVVG